MISSTRGLTEINSFGDIAKTYHRVRSLSVAKGDLGLEDSIEHTLNRVSLVAAYAPQEASIQYRQTYMDLKLKEQALSLITDPEVIEAITIEPPKLSLTDPKAGNPLPFEMAKTEVEILLSHLDILRDDLNFRFRTGGKAALPPSLESYFAAKEHYAILRRRLVNYLVVKGIYSDARALELWQKGFACDKPTGPSTYFRLAFDNFEIIVDFQKGLY